MPDKYLYRIKYGLCSVLLIPALALAGVAEYELDNGLRLLVKPDRRAPVVVSQVWYKVGGSYETDGITGVSHALEHMMFKGTALHPAGEFSRIIADHGGRDNAFTGPDYTAYFQTLESSRLAISFRLEADRMQNLILRQEEFDKEIEVVKEERRLRTEDQPQSYLYETARATAFQTSPYRYPVIGWMQDLESMTVSELADWYQKWYAPNNATLVVVGDVEPEAVYTLAKRYFGGLPRGEPVALNSLEEVPQRGMKRVTVKRPAELPYLLMAYKTPALKPAAAGLADGMADPAAGYDWEPYALEVLAGILDGGDSARFARRLIRADEVAAAAGVSYQWASRLDNLLSISGTPAGGRSTAELERAFRAEILDLQTRPVSGAELERVKAQVISSEVYERDSVFFQAYVLGVLETIGLSWRLAESYVERVRAVTPEQIMAVANKYLVDDRLTVAELEPLPLAGAD